jgi:hypothetical protein
MPVRAPLGAEPLAGRDLARYARDADVIHAWSVSAGRAARMASRLSHRPMVLSLPGQPYSKVGASLAVRPDGFHITVPAEAARRAMARAGSVDRVHVLPLAVKEPAQPARPIVASGTVLLWAPGEATFLSGHRHAVWVVEILRQMGLDVSAAIAPTGPGGAALRRFAACAGGQHTVRWLTEPPANVACCLLLCEKPDDLTAAAAALACGAPIVASDLAPLRELLGDAALYAPPLAPREQSAAALRVLEEPDLAQNLTAAAAARATQLRAQAARGQLESIYASAARPEPQAAFCR